jgi:hypothetical protein
MCLLCYYNTESHDAKKPAPFRSRPGGAGCAGPAGLRSSPACTRTRTRFGAVFPRWIRRCPPSRGYYHIKDPHLKKQVLAMQDRMAEILSATDGDPRNSGKGSEGDTFAL